MEKPSVDPFWLCCWSTVKVDAGLEISFAINFNSILDLNYWMSGIEFWSVVTYPDSRCWYSPQWPRHTPAPWRLPMHGDEFETVFILRTCAIHKPASTANGRNIGIDLTDLEWDHVCGDLDDCHWSAKQIVPNGYIFTFFKNHGVYNQNR